SSATSVRTKSPWPPRAASSSATAFPVVSLSSATTTRAPSSSRRWAKTRPMPWPAPVTMTTLSSSLTPSSPRPLRVPHRSRGGAPGPRGPAGRALRDAGGARATGGQSPALPCAPLPREGECAKAAPSVGDRAVDLHLDRALGEPLLLAALAVGGQVRRLPVGVESGVVPVLLVEEEQIGVLGGPV